MQQLTSNTILGFNHFKHLDYVNWKKLFKVPREIRVPAHVVDLMESLHEFNTMMLRVDG